MEFWVGPAIVAAFISGLVSLIVVQLNFRQERHSERLRREEKTRDFQIALLAEIESELINLEVVDRHLFFDQLRDVLSKDATYVPLIPRLSSNPVFAAVVTEIHILPGDIIGPVVHYARFRETLERFVEDVRSEQFMLLPAARRLLVYADYTAMFDRLESLATAARSALDTSLKVNKRAWVRSSRSPARDEASGEGSRT